MADIPRRDPIFDLDPRIVPRDWATDPYTTTFLAALSLLFPEGERFFVESVKQHAKLVTTDELRRDVSGFINQEAMHGKAHRDLNAMLVGHGYTEAPAIENRLRAFLIGVRRVLPPKSQLAVTVALEHFTAILAEKLLSDRRMRAEFSSTMIDLWTWHALEEAEHKAVCFDVYRAANGNYLHRTGMMLVTTAVFFAAVLVAQTRLAHTRGILWKPWRWARGLSRMWIYPGYFVRLLPGYLAFFKPGFHPNDHDAAPLLEHWREQLFSSSYSSLSDRAASSAR